MYNDIILKLLTITEYKEDKEAFITDFARITSSQALVDLVQSLPAENQEEADATIASADSQEKFQEAVKKYFSDKQVVSALDEASANAITQWISSIASTLNDEQRQKLITLSVELQEKMDASKSA